ncbi:hypothetical protein GS432_04840 [Rhodococcus hoagii]|nr:hypothetical protein [Prescottella equi]
MTTPVVPDAPTTTTLTVPATTVKGTATTLTATVTPANASGSVQFLDGQTPIGGPPTVTNGTASVQHSFATSGNHSIGACSPPARASWFDGDGQVDHGDRSGGRRRHDHHHAHPSRRPAETGQQITLTAIWIRPTPPGSVQFKTAPPTSVDRWP